MTLSIAIATARDATAIAEILTATASDLTDKFGPGPWSSASTEKGVLFGMKTAQTLIAREGKKIVGTLRLANKKPWAIDPTYFTPARKPFYLTSMAVAPPHQRLGIGTLLIEEALSAASFRLGDAIRLDAYAAEAGAGGFYTKCSFCEVGRVTYRKTPLIYFELML